jgi:uncharacterized protein YkuJ
MEYQEGRTECTDCHVSLVEELPKVVEMEPFLQAVDKDPLEKLAGYFDYSGLKSEVRYIEENEVFELSIPAKKQKQAKKLYQAFLIVESERASRTAFEASSSANKSGVNQPEADDDASEESKDILNEASDSIDYADEEPMDPETSEETDEEDETANHQSSTVYVMKADRYKELKETVWLFLLFGVGGIAVVVLNLVGIFDFLNGVIPILVLSALFLYFIYVGLSSHKKAKQVQSEIEAERKLTEEINGWLVTNVTESVLNKLHNDTISNELNYIKKTEAIKEMLIKEFGDQNTAYLDRLIEEFYNNQFE